jgi:hypothetical protein
LNQPSTGKRTQARFGNGFPRRAVAAEDIKKPAAICVGRSQVVREHGVSDSRPNPRDPRRRTAARTSRVACIEDPHCYRIKLIDIPGTRRFWEGVWLK